MQARTAGTGAARQADEARQWVEAWADHVRKRFNSRALVSARIAGGVPVLLSQVYALEGGGIVLVTPCDHEGDEAHEHSGHDHAGDEHAEHEHAEHDHAAHEHAEHDQAAHDHDGHVHVGVQHAAHDDGGLVHVPGGEHHHRAEEGGGAGHDHAAHPHGEVDGCCGDGEVWLSSPAAVVFQARCAPEGTLCTGFGVLGLSRTPHVLVARGREAPPPRGHDH
jgi:hypothetical protein